jgi:ribonuclease PH
MTRTSRRDDELRPLSLEPGAAAHAEGSCLITTGGTRVLCAASVLDEVPRWREGDGAGWVTAEYGMLPRSTHSRRSRERAGAGGRTLEIQRLIGRALRAVTDLGRLGPRTVIVDCDVLQADGGTRTAAITGGCVALALALRHLLERELLDELPLTGLVGAVSVGLVDERALLDLDYREDSRAQVDMNVVGTDDGRLVEVQGTAEGDPFSRKALDELVDLAEAGIRTLVAAQRELLETNPAT